MMEEREGWEKEGGRKRTKKGERIKEGGGKRKKG
jgi:hypothetical protein